MKVQGVITDVVKLWPPPPRQTVCEWAIENFVVTTGANKGRFRPAAYQVEPINAIGDPAINEIVIMSATQMLKTITILIGITYVIARDPDPIMVVMPRDSDVGKFSKFRLASTLREMPVLRGRVSDPKARNSSTTIDTKDFPGGPLIMTAAGSPGNLGAYAIRYLYCDEVDKYPRSSGPEGNPIAVANKRTATYRSPGRGFKPARLLSRASRRSPRPTRRRTSESSGYRARCVANIRFSPGGMPFWEEGR